MVKECNKSFLYVIALIVLTTFIYLPSLNNSFTSWDDPVNVVDNAYIRSFSISNIKAWVTEPLLAMYTPLIYFSYAIDYKIGGLNPFIYHLHNLLLHLINIALVFLMLRLLTKRDEVAIIAVLLFAIHPLNVAAVAPVSTRGTLLYSMFFLLSLISYIYYLQKGKDKRYYYASLFLFLLSALSKSQSVVLPLVFLIIDYYNVRIKINNELNIKKDFGILWEKMPFFVVSLVFGILTIIFREDAGHIWSPYSFSLIDRPFLISYSFVFYIWKLFLPFNLSAYYSYPDNTSGYLPIEYYLSPLIILFIVFLILKVRVMRKELIFGFLFYMINIVLVLKIIPMGHENVCDRYAYMPNIGWFFIIGQAYCYVRDKKINFIIERHNQKAIFKLILVVFVFYTGFFSLISYNRTTIWKDTFTLFDDILKRHPRLSFVYNNIGIEKYKNGDYIGAIVEFNKAIEYGPTFKKAYYNRAKAYSKMSEHAKAIEDYTKAISISEDATLYSARGIEKTVLKDYEGAEEDFNRAITIMPDYTVAYNNMALIRVFKGDYEGAIKYYTKVIELDNKDAEAYVNRGNVKAMIGNTFDALVDYKKALEIDPKHSGAYLNRGIAKLSLKDGTACLDWQKAAEFGEKQANELLRQYCIR